MKVRVRLFGTLGRLVDGASKTDGIVVELAKGATVSQLLSQLEITARMGAGVVRDGRILKKEEELHPGDDLTLIQVVAGG